MFFVVLVFYCFCLPRYLPYVEQRVHIGKLLASCLVGSLLDHVVPAAVCQHAEACSGEISSF